MKNLNLIKRLWTDSHEKQKVRSVHKYCILLLLLFMCFTHTYAGDTPPTTKTVSNLIIFQSKTAARSAWMWKDSGTGTVRNFTVSSQVGGYYVSTYNNASNKYNKLIAFTAAGTDGSTSWPNLDRISGSNDVVAPSITSGENWYLKNDQTTSQTPNPNKQFVHLSVSTSLSSSSVTTGTTVSVNYSSLTGDLSIAANNKWNFFYSTDGGSTKTRFSTEDRTYATSGSSAPSFAPAVAGSYTVYAYLSDPWGFEVIKREMSLTVSDPTYTVTYYGNGNTSGSAPSDGSSPYTSGSTVTVLGKNTLTKTNYTFAGWNTSSNGTGTYYAPGATFSITANKSLYAMWIPTAVLGGTQVMAYCGELTDWNQSTYKFKNSSGTELASVAISGSTTVVDDTYKTGVVTLAPNTTYYNQGHWDSGLDCAIEAGYLYVVRGSKTSTYFTQKDVNNSNYLYRVSQQNSSTAATRTVTTTLGSSSFAEGTSNLSVSTSGGPGKSVLGRTNKLLYFLYNGSTWSPVTLSAGNLNVSSLTDGSYSLASVLTDGYIYVRADKDDFNVYAVYSITYRDKDDEDYSGDNLASLPTSYNHGTGIASLTAGVKDGYIFNGWFDNSSCTGDPVTTIGTSATGDKTFYAKWTEDLASYTVSFDLQGHGSAISDQDVESGGTVEEPSDPSATGYIFGGWYKEPGCTNAWNFGSDKVTEKTILYAKWTAKTYTAADNLDKNGGDSHGKYTATYDATTIAINTTPSRSGYTVEGYYKQAACTNKIASSAGALVASTSYTDESSHWTNDGNETLYTNWTPNPYTITFNGNKGSRSGTVTNIQATVTVTYDDDNFNISSTPVSSVAIPVLAGYTFGGYYTAIDGGGIQIVAADGSWIVPGSGKGNSYLDDDGNWVQASNTTVYAKWTAKTYDITYVDANSVATIAANPSTGSTDATINFTVTLKDGYKSLSVTAVDAGSNTVTVTNPSSNNYRFTRPANDVTVTVTATALPVVYVLKTKHANSSLGDGATGFPSTGQIWAWKASSENNFYTSASWPGPSASSKATVITDDIIGDEWYRFIPDNTSYFDGSTAYHVILTNSNRILDTQSTFIEDGSSQMSATHTGTIWIVPHGTDANTAYLYTSYPDMIATPYNVTYNAGDHGDVEILETTITSGNSQTILTKRNSTLTATPASGYAFNRWKTTGSVTVADATSATTTVTATAAGGTVTATYFEVVNSGWYIKGDPAGGDWGTPTSLPLNRLLPGETNVYYRPVTLPANDQYFRFWHDEVGKPQYGASTGNLAVSKDTKYDISKDDGKDGNAFKYSAGGTLWFVIDESAKKFWLQDPVEFYSVNFGYGDGCDEFTAKDGEDHDLVSGNTYVSGTELTFTQTKKDGYTFVGWNTAADGSGSSLGTGSSYTVASLSADVNVYAIYTENKTAITITTDGHGTITTPSPNNSPYSLGVATTQAIDATASAGYHWNTWTVSGTAALVSAASMQSNTVKGDGTDGGTGTVTATFTANTWYVRFNRNGGTTGDDMSNESFTYDAVAKALTTNTYTRSGYTFQGWATTQERANAGTVDYADGATVRNLTSTNGGYVDLYAVWTANKYTITLEDYDPDSWGTYLIGDCGANPVTEFVVQYNTNYFDCYLNGESQPIKVPYDFNGWYSGQGGAGDEIVSAYGVLATGATAYTNASGKWNYADDVTIYAKWTLTLSGYSEIEAETGALYSTGSITFTYNSASTSSFTAATRTGYILDGYYTAADGDKVVNADGTLVADVDGWTDEDGKWIYSTSSTPSLYTKWTPITYTVAFDKDNIAKYVYDAEGSMDPVAATRDVDVTLPANTFTREGYSFRGWSKTSDGTLFCLDKATVTNLSSTQGETVTLYALWTGNPVTVSFNPREGSMSAYCRSVDLHVGDTYGSGTCTASGLPEPTPPSGYVFTGWYTSSVGGTKVTEETVVTTTGDHTLYARYAEQATVYFKNSIGWSEVYVTYDAYWDNTNGTGNNGKIYHKMSLVSGTTDIYKDEIPSTILSSWKGDIAFNSQELLNENKHAPQESGNYGNYNKGEVVYRMDFDSRATMFVPKDVNTNNTDGNYQKNSAQYISTGYKDGTSSDPEYTSGYWMKYGDTYSGYLFSYQKNAEGDFSAEYKMNTAIKGETIFVYSVKMEANTRYDLRIRKDCQTTNTKSRQFRYATQITSAACTDLKLVCDPSNNSWMQTTVAGEYKFILTCKKDGHMYLSVEYPLAVNDYRVLYSYTKGSAQTFSSEYIKAKENAVDTISMFIHSADDASSRSLYIQKCTAIDGSGVPTWDEDYSEITLPTETASGKTSGVYNFVITQDGSKAATGEAIGKYDGNYYIRCEAADGGWDQYKYRADNLMTFSEYSLSQTLSAPYSHYFCKYVDNFSTDITYTIATDYSPMICPILEGDATIGGVGNKTLPSGNPASVRFTWNQETNATFRSYLKSAQGDGNKRFLVLHGSDNKVLDAGGNTIAGEGEGAEQMHANELLFSDTENWVYDLAFKAQPGAAVSIIARYNGSDRYLVGAADAWETIISGGTSATKYDIAAVYDFKTNRLITTWIPSGTISEEIEEVDVLIERQYQGGGTTITFGKATEESEAGSISAKRVIGALKFDYNDLVGRVASWTTDTRAKLMYFVSFPFDVNVSDIFGLNTEYGDAFVVQHYNSKLRAKKGFFGGDGTETFWEDMPVDTVMHANVGYVVVMDNDYMNGDIGHVWDNKKSGEHVYLYFPSANDPSDPIILNAESKTVTLPEYKCNIDRTFSGGKLNHKYTDSNWNVMGVPIFQNHTGSGASGTPGAIFTPTSAPSDTSAYIDHPDLGYFYKWATDKSYTVTSAVGYTFLPMHSYLVQYAGNVTFTQAEPAVVSAPRKALKEEENYKIELQVLNSNEDMLNRTYVELRENAVDSFALNEDLFMVTNKHAVNVYTFAGTYDVSANVLSIGSHIVQVGVIVNQAGTYTFTMPSNFSGSVTLIDTYADVRTNLALGDYEVNLPKGTNDERFLLEININKVPTAIDGAGAGQGSLKDGKAHKFIMNDMMYILKDGVLYDARGNRVK